MSFNKLYFNSVSLKSLSDRVEFEPRFICPKCRKYFEGKITADSPKHALTQHIMKPIRGDLNFNGKITFTMPCCGTKINLYGAIHGEDFCISVEPIEPDWWMNK